MRGDLAVQIRTVAQRDQRYPTAGDWEFKEDGTLVITVSSTGILEFSLLVAVHELVEAMLCKHEQIPEGTVTAWDVNYKGPYPEPGDDPDAPYHIAHNKAMAIERVLAEILDIDWQEYEQILERISEDPDAKDRPA